MSETKLLILPDLLFSLLLLLPYQTQFHLLGTMKPQINYSFAFKRCVNANQAKVAEIREDKHEKATKHSTFWAVNVVILGAIIIEQRFQTYDVRFILTFI